MLFFKGKASRHQVCPCLYFFRSACEDKNLPFLEHNSVLFPGVDLSLLETHVVSKQIVLDILIPHCGLNQISWFFINKILLDHYLEF